MYDREKGQERRSFATRGAFVVTFLVPVWVELSGQWDSWHRWQTCSSHAQDWGKQKAADSIATPLFTIRRQDPKPTLIKPGAVALKQFPFNNSTEQCIALIKHISRTKHRIAAIALCKGDTHVKAHPRPKTCYPYLSLFFAIFPHTDE